MKLSTKSISKCFNEFLVLRSLDVNNQNSSTPSSDVITKSGLMEDLRLFFAEPNNTNESKDNLLKINISIIYNHSNLIHWFHYWCYWYYIDVTLKKRQNSEYALQSESTLHSCLNVKELLVRNRHDIWSLSDSNEIRNHDHEVRKGKLKW